MIILHGWGSSKEKWQAVKKKTEAEGIRVVVPDLPGFKRETRLEEPWSLDDYLRWLEEFVGEKRKAGLLGKRFFLLGHSFGGSLALNYTASHPGSLSGLILVSAAVLREKTDRIVLLARLANFFHRFSFLPGYGLFRKLFYYHLLKRPDYVSAEGALRKTFKRVINEDLRSLLPRIEVPTLLLWGAEDEATPLREGEMIEGGIEDSRLVVLGGIGHRPHLKGVERLVRPVVDFIRSEGKV